MTSDEEGIYQAFFEAQVEGGIEPLARTTHELIGCPVIVADDAATRIVQYPDEPDTRDTTWNEIYYEGAIQYDNYFKALDDVKALNITPNQPTIMRAQMLYFGVHMATVFEHRGSMVGFASVFFGDREPTEREQLIVRIFAKALQPELAQRYPQSRQYDEHLGTVCEAEDRTSQAYRASLVALRKRYAGSYQVLYVEDLVKGMSTSLEKVRRTAGSEIYQVAIAGVSDGLVVLLHGIMPGTPTAKQMAALLERYPVRAALSTPFDDASAIADHFIQARATLAAGRVSSAEGQVLTFDDVAPLQTIALLAEHVDLSVLIRPEVKEMVAFDAANGTEWTKTLETYLRHFMRKPRTAESLGIHPNSLTYRLERIQQLFGIDLNDEARASDIYLSLLMAKFVNR